MSSAVLVSRLPDPSSSFREDAPEAPSARGRRGDPHCASPVKGPGGQGPARLPSAPEERGRAGEPEGRASPDSPADQVDSSLCTPCWAIRTVLISSGLSWSGRNAWIL